MSKTQPIPRRKNRNSACVVESIESRLLMSGHSQDVGTLNGRFFRQGSVFGSDKDRYEFEMPRAGKIDVQLSRLIGTGTMTLRDSNGDTIATAGASTKDRRITFDASSAGDFSLDVQADQHQFAPAVFYTLAIVSDTAPGATFNHSLDVKANSFRNLGTLTESHSTTARDFIGFSDTSNHAAGDSIDTYKFVVPSVGDTDINLTGIDDSDPADAFAKVDALVTIYQDANNNGRLEPSETDPNSDLTPAAARGILFSPLSPGTYFAVVTGANLAVGGGIGANPTIGGTNYKLDIVFHQRDLAGNTLNKAQSVALDANATTRRDLLDANDTVDIYKFDLTDKGPFNFDAKLNIDNPSPANFSIDLVRDTNHDGQPDAAPSSLINRFNVNVPVRSLAGSVTHLTQTLTDPGTYFLRVKRISGESGYTITMSAPSADRVGNTLGTARNLGALANNPTFSDFVGRIDSADVYRVNAAQAGEMRVNVTNINSGDVKIDVIRDANNNGQINANEILATRSIGHVLDGVVLPAAGNYFVRIRPGSSSKDVNYHLALSFSNQSPFSATPILIGSNSDTRIEAENFDNGGEGVAFHDTDGADGPQNGVDFRSDTGVDLRTTNDPQGGNFRLASTKAGEFLEYTVKVQNTGTFNFDYRVSSPGDGATFHMEVDGEDVTGPIVIPNTGGVDNMTTIPSGVSNVQLAAGPHVFRIAFDHQTGGGNGTPDIAGTMNFLVVKPV